VIVTGEVIVTVSTSADPADFLAFFCDRKHACVYGLAVDSLLFVTSNWVYVSQGHELLDRAMHEDEVSVLVVMWVQVLLLFKPFDCLHTEAWRPWEIVWTGCKRGRIKSINAHQLLITSCVHDWNARSVVPKLFFGPINTCIRFIPLKTWPAKLLSERPIDWKRCCSCHIGQITAACANVRDFTCHDAFHRALPMTFVVRFLCGIDNVTCDNNQVRLLLFD